MLLGLGSDIADIRRIEKTLERFGVRFEQRCFSEGERALAQRRKGAGAKIVAGTYAKRYAAKEACAKALGTGLNQGVAWRDIEVVRLPSGQPSLRLHGKAKQRLEVMLPPGMRAVLHLTLTDEYPYAQAIVMVSAIAESAATV